jgi:hypothetical protein
MTGEKQVPGMTDDMTMTCERLDEYLQTMGTN